MPAPDIFYVERGNEAHKDVLETDAWAAIDAVMMGKSETAQAIMLDWALHCREVKGSEAKMVMAVKGVSFLEAYLLMDPSTWNSDVFRIWIDSVYYRCAKTEQRESWFPLFNEQNNRAAWGVLGLALSNIILGHSSNYLVERLERMMDRAIGPDGCMKIEILRTNMGIWYSTFALMPMLRACQIVANSPMDRLYAPLCWLWQYIQNPQSWPYRPGQGIWSIFPKIERILHPTSDTLVIFRANDTSGALYLAAGRHFGVQEWIDYAEPWDAGGAPFPGVNEFRWQS